jgi:acid stress-induced BolA-like protein IbaG/YrbA
MDLKEKVEHALSSHLQVDNIELVDDNGIYGFVVSPDFRGMSAIDRQTLIDHALRDPKAKLSKREFRQILVIAALTPVEYEVRGLGSVGWRG